MTCVINLLIYINPLISYGDCVIFLIPNLDCLRTAPIDLSLLRAKKNLRFLFEKLTFQYFFSQHKIVTYLGHKYTCLEEYLFSHLLSSHQTVKGKMNNLGHGKILKLIRN